jgi:hypothetical protein
VKVKGKDFHEMLFRKLCDLRKGKKG